MGRWFNGHFHMRGILLTGIKIQLTTHNRGVNGAGITSWLCTPAGRRRPLQKFIIYLSTGTGGRKPGFPT